MSGRPKEFDPRETLGAAVNIFWKCGYESTSLAQLVDELNINRQSLYDTYGDKRALFMEVLKAYSERAGADFREVLTRGPSPVARLHNFLEMMRKRLLSNSGRGCLLTNTIVELGLHDVEVRGYISNVLKQLENALAETIRQAVAAGELSRATHPRRTARLFLTIMQGVLVLSKTDLASSGADAIRLAETLLLPPAGDD